MTICDYIRVHQQCAADCERLLFTLDTVTVLLAGHMNICYISQGYVWRWKRGGGCTSFTGFTGFHATMLWFDVETRGGTILK